MTEPANSPPEPGAILAGLAAFRDPTRLAVAALVLAAVVAILALGGVTLFTVLAAVLAIATLVVGYHPHRRSTRGLELAWWTLLVADGGLAYWFLTPLGALSVVFYLIAIGTIALGWRLDARYAADKKLQLASVILATLVLLAGKNFSGQIPWQGLFFTTVTIVTFAIFALGLNLEFGFGGLINFGHVAFMGMGAYTVALLAEQGGFWTTQTGIFTAFLIALVIAALAGLLLALPAIRLREDYLAIVTIAAAEIFRRILISEQDLTHGAQGVVLRADARPLNLGWLEAIPLAGPQLAGGLERLADAMAFTGSPYMVLLLLVAVLLIVALLAMAERLVNSPWGRVVEAIREDEDAARSLGVNPTVYKLQVFALGSAIAAGAGAIWAWQLSFIVPQHFAPLRTFWGWIIIVIGGVANNKGAIAGAFVFWTISNLSQGLAKLEAYGFDSGQIAAFSPLALGLLLIGFMMTKPEGLFGDKEELELVE